MPFSWANAAQFIISKAQEKAHHDAQQAVGLAFMDRDTLYLIALAYLVNYL